MAGASFLLGTQTRQKKPQKAQHRIQQNLLIVKLPLASFGLLIIALVIS